MHPKATWALTILLDKEKILPSSNINTKKQSHIHLSIQFHGHHILTLSPLLLHHHNPTKPPQTPPSTKPHLPIPPSNSKSPLPTTLTTTLTATVLATTILITSPPSLADTLTYQLYYGTAASAADYGGYGGNSSKKDSAEYIYEVPAGWKERLVSKVEKGTNGTDSEFYNPKKKSEREYLTFLAGFRQLAKDAVLNNLALSDVYLQDLTPHSPVWSSETFL